MGLNRIIKRESKARTVCLRAVGDINFSGGIGTRLHKQRDYNPLPRLQNTLGNAPLRFFNLECNPVSDAKTADSPSSMIAPASFLEEIREEFNIACIANNHITDAGAAAFLETIEQLRSRHFTIVGGGKDVEEADSLRIIDENGIRFGIIACADFVYAPHRKGNHAGKTKPGVSIYKPKTVIKRIHEYQSYVDILICSLHTGLEFHSYPDPVLMKDAHAMIDAGATIILVHHAHVRQGIEEYKNGLIAYGLGNLMFDINDPYMQQEDASTDIGLVLDIFTDKQGVTGYTFWLSKIHPGGRTTILADLDSNIARYEEQRDLNDNLSDPILIKREWKKVCKKYFKDRCYSLYGALKNREFLKFFHLVLDLKRRENRRWIAGLLGL